MLCSSLLSISVVFWLPSSFPMSFFHCVTQKWKQQYSSSSSLTPNSEGKLLPLTHVYTVVLSFILAREHIILRAWSSAVENCSSFPWLEELRVRRDKYGGGKKLLGTSVSLFHSLFLGWLTEKDSWNAYMKSRVCAAPLPAFGSGMPVLWNNFETTEINSAVTLCGFVYSFVVVLLFSVGFFVGQFVCLFF